jgi:hypothetical protein
MKSGIGEKLFFGISSLVVSIAVITAFFLMGSPAEQRMKKFDSKRVSDLRRTKQAVDYYYRSNKELPADLNAVAKIWTQVVQNDPEIGKPYTYRVVDSDSYELCARFSTESEGRVNMWSHPKGEHCFSFDVKPRR